MARTVVTWRHEGGEGAVVVRSCRGVGSMFRGCSRPLGDRSQGGRLKPAVHQRKEKPGLNQISQQKRTPFVTFAKERIEAVDDGNKLVSYSVIDGELVSFYKPFNATLQVVPKSDGGLVKWCLNYDKVNEEVPQPDFVLGTAVKTFKDLDAYLLQK